MKRSVKLTQKIALSRFIVSSFGSLVGCTSVEPEKIVMSSMKTEDSVNVN
ncbi:hypothetical protein [Brevibacillus laterosporus]|uniref:Uncharacterized protein n=1 Tax=Brevibacillus laterosporus TaxID=1465 RepID=A0AAP3DFL2_BRELA|nr:hypothetical protein [Brevibacillus laterosporus]MCR8980168.1 hypothetical protein [Brevibacillus laterosporus]MCZ0807323.1 hypothetical protein [Brevibacillus laterosporus]MCZ0825568.1 hypothetical protein [Brevibacillus laterosporus]MCZ0849345.1 hypothetical protein [Brevibacillus laterosporus]